jgi:hypothetical protein
MLKVQVLYAKALPWWALDKLLLAGEQPRQTAICFQTRSGWSMHMPVSVQPVGAQCTFFDKHLKVHDRMVARKYLDPELFFLSGVVR